MDEGQQPQPAQSGELNLYQPNEVIMPTTAQPVQTTAQPEPNDAQTPLPEPTTPASVPPTEAAAMPTLPVETATMPAQPTESAAQPGDGVITWTASEYIANQKSSGWYMRLGGAAIVVGILVWLLTRDFYPTIAVLAGVVLLGVYAGRPPREESYSLDAQGLTIGNRRIGYHDFHSFSVIAEGPFVSIQLTPHKRFAMETTIYVDPKDEDRIIDHLSQYLPLEEAKPSFTDNLMRRIKF